MQYHQYRFRRAICVAPIHLLAASCILYASCTVAQIATRYASELEDVKVKQEPESPGENDSGVRLLKVGDGTDVDSGEQSMPQVHVDHSSRLWDKEIPTTCFQLLHMII